MGTKLFKKACLAGILVAVSMTAVPLTAEATPRPPQVTERSALVICWIVPRACR